MEWTVLWSRIDIGYVFTEEWTAAYNIFMTGRSLISGQLEAFHIRRVGEGKGGFAHEIWWLWHHRCCTGAKKNIYSQGSTVGSDDRT